MTDSVASVECLGNSWHLTVAPWIYSWWVRFPTTPYLAGPGPRSVLEAAMVSKDFSHGKKGSIYCKKGTLVSGGLHGATTHSPNNT